MCQHQIAIGIYWMMQSGYNTIEVTLRSLNFVDGELLSHCITDIPSLVVYNAFVFDGCALLLVLAM